MNCSLLQESPLREPLLFSGSTKVIFSHWLDGGSKGKRPSEGGGGESFRLGGGARLPGATARVEGSFPRWLKIINSWGYAGFSPPVHVPRFYFGPIFEPARLGPLGFHNKWDLPDCGIFRG